MTGVSIFPLVISMFVSIATSKPLEQIIDDDDDLQHFSWQFIELQLLSKSAIVQTDRTSNSPNFHVISVKFSENEATYILHLTKPHGLFHSENLNKYDEYQETDLQCIYEGSINKILQNGVQVEGGTLSLSNCYHQEYPGFEGLLLLHDQHFYIKPDVVQVNYTETNDANSSDTQTIKHRHKPIMRHRAYKLNNSSRPSFSKDLDATLRVPPEDLQKWGRNRTTNYDELIDKESTTATSNAPLMNKRKSLDLPVIKVPSESTTNTTTSKIVVEIAVFTDEKLFNKWKSRFPKNTTGKIRQYILAVVNNMNALYNQPSMTEKISFRLVNIEIATSQPKNLNESDGHAISFLRSFCSYAAEKNLDGTLWDHALLLTGVDLQENGNNITAGIAWYSTMCVNGLSCSVVEATSFQSAFVSTHEVGHSLGMDHDGSALNSDCNANSSIMSPSTGGGKTNWSKCSIRNMKQFLDRGYLGTNPPKCLFKKSSKIGEEIKYSSDKLPGKQFPAKIQCSSFCGSKFTPYVTKKKPYNNICHLLHCQQKQGQYTIVESIHPALEGTPCAKGKVCRLGKCRKL